MRWGVSRQVRMYGGFGPHGHEGRSLLPLPPCFHSPSPLAKKRATMRAEKTGWAEVGGISTLLLDNASTVWFEGEGFFAWLCYGVGNDVEIECIRHSGNLWVSAPTPMPSGTSCIDHNMEAHVACFHHRARNDLLTLVRASQLVRDRFWKSPFLTQF